MLDIPYLNAEKVEELFPIHEAIAVIETAFLDYQAGLSRMPEKVYLDLPEFQGDFRAMPAFCARHKLAGVKWVNSHSQNYKKGLPAVMALLIVNDPETGAPKAILDATNLTGIRTGAAGAVAVNYLARKNAKIAAFVGAGKQAIYQALAIGKVRDLEEIRFFDPSEHARKNFQETFPKAKVFNDIKPCVSNSDIVVTTTPSRQPIVQRDWISRGTHINAVGADAPGKQELDPGLLEQATVIVDDVEQARHSGEINLSPDCKISGTLGQVIAKKVSGRISDDQITVFDSTGLAIQDVASAGWILGKFFRAD